MKNAPHAVMRPAVRIGRELLKVSATSRSPLTWSPSMDQTLHSLGFRHSISPSLVSRVIDPFLLSTRVLQLGRPAARLLPRLRV
ncbi:unnamed protein product [Brassica oleracea var. botrytis]